MPHLISDHMGNLFVVNEYVSSIEVARSVPVPSDLTEQGQSDSVREILNRYARQGVVDTPPDSKSRYVMQFADDEPLDGDKVNTLLDMPDLSYMDELEVSDFISQNSDFQHFTEPAAVTKSDDPPEKSPEESSAAE